MVSQSKLKRSTSVVFIRSLRRAESDKKNNGAGWGEGREVTRLTYRFALNHSHKAREGTVYVEVVIFPRRFLLLTRIRHVTRPCTSARYLFPFFRGKIIRLLDNMKLLELSVSQEHYIPKV